MPDVEKAVSHALHHKQEALDNLISFLRIPSISTENSHKQDVNRAANWAADQLREVGANPVQVYETEGHRLVFGSLQGGDAQAPTLLVYGHTDVQPVEPLEEWHSDPFNPDVRGDDIFARGATDMKAQIVSFLHAVASIQQTTELPLNLKFLFEGEEEIGSPNLEPFLRQHSDMLACDICVNLDAGILAPETPAIMFGLRGLAYYEIRLQGPAADLHSGKFGGAIENPALVLCELIAGMRDDKGQVTLPGFYDSVRELSMDERQEIQRLPQTDAWWLEQTGAPALRQGHPYSATERATSRPTLDVNGLLSGFTGEGSKTVLPAQAMAKISMRLVPDQTPEQVSKGLIDYLEANVPSTMTWKLEELASAHPAILNLESKAVAAASEALQAVWNTPPIFNRDGGTVPVVGLIKELLGVDSLLLGFGLPDDNPHAPNEKQHLPTFYRGIETYIRFIYQYAAMEGS